MSLTLEKVIDIYAHTKVGNCAREMCVKCDEIQMTNQTIQTISIKNH